MGSVCVFSASQKVLRVASKRRRSDQGLSEKATNRMRISRQTSSSRANNVSRGISLSCGPRAKKVASHPAGPARIDSFEQTTPPALFWCQLPSEIRPLLCALSVSMPFVFKFLFPASLFIPTVAPEKRLVAQGAAHARPRRAPVECAGPEAFSLFALCSRRLQAARTRLTDPFVVTPLECALTQKHQGGGCASRTLHTLRLPRCIHGRNIVASDNSGNAEKRKQIPRAYAALGMTTTR